MPKDNCLLRGERGSAMVELAICAPVLCLLFVGSMEFHKLTNYKRKVIGATRYACWEMVARKGEANLEKNVATEMRNLWFPEIPFDPNQAVVGNFPNDNSQGSRVQLKVEKMSSLGDLTESGGRVYGWTVGKVAAQGWDFGIFRLGYGLASANDDRIKTTVRMTYQPTFFPIIMNFLTLKESQLQDQSRRPRSWNTNANLMSIGGDVTFARMVLCNGTWDEYRREQIVERVRGMWCPLIGEVLNKLSSLTFGIMKFDCFVEPDLVCPYNQPNWWESPPCKCTHSQNSSFQNGGAAEDPTAGMQAEREEQARVQAELEQRIRDDQARMDAIDAEIRARQSDNDPNNDDVSALQAERRTVAADKAQAEADLRTVTGR